MYWVVLLPVLCGELLAGHDSGLPQHVVLSGVELNISGLL